MDRLEHLSDEELSRFYRGELAAGESRRIVRHLLSGCPTCRQRSAGRWGAELSPAAAAGSAGGGGARRRFDEIFDRAANAALSIGSRIQDERNAAPALLGELLRHPVERQRLMVANSRRFRGYGLAEALVEAAFESGFDDPARAIEQAELATFVAERLSAADYGERLVNDLLGRAWGALGNAERIASRLRDAAGSIGRGLDFAARGTGDPSERARLLSFLASLRAGQQRFDEALTTHDEMLKIYQALGDRHLTGRTEGQKAFVLRRMGEAEKAIVHSRRALSLMDARRDPRGVLAVRQGLVMSLLEIGRLDEAHRRCTALRREWLALGNDLDVVRCEWMEGKILQRMGRTEQATERFRHVRDRLVEQSIPYDAALATLDLAEALFDQGKTAEMGRRLGEAIPVFRGLGIHRETIAALAFLHQATQRQRVSLALIRATARFIEESRRDPELRFRSSALATES